MLKDIVSFLSAALWPVTILIIAYWFRLPFIHFFERLKGGRGAEGRNLRLKMGQFEIESRIEADIQKRLEEVAEEPSLKKRLELAKQPFLVDAALQELDEKSIDALKTLYEKRLKNAAWVNWYEPIHGIDNETLSTLSKMRLIGGSPMYDGDEIVWITPVGLAVLEKVMGVSASNE